jgi:hypothetical protein
MHAVAVADLQELQELLRARRAELAEARRLESIERERERRASLAQRRHWQLSGAVLKVALIIYQLARANTEPVVVYLRAQARKRHWPEREDADIAELAVWAFLRADDGVYIDLTDIDAPSDPAAMRTALDYVEQWRVARDALEHNLARGAALSSGSLLHRFEEARQQLPEALRPRHRGVGAESKGRSFMSRFRMRWGGRYGAFKVRDQVPLPVLLSKARRYIQPFSVQPSRFCLVHGR